MGCTIVGCGKAFPALKITNDELTALVDTNDEWISTRTGIKSRRVAVQESNTDLSEIAARQALGWNTEGYSQRVFDASEIDLVIFATMTPDAMVPSNAALLRRRLGLSNALCFDLNAACSGFVYALSVAESLIAASSNPDIPGSSARNPIRRALVIGSERISRVTDWTDRNTCVLFGDGAGAAVIEWDESRKGILGSYLVNEDDSTGALTTPVTYAAPIPFNTEGINLNPSSSNDPAQSLLDQELHIDMNASQSGLHQAIRMDGQKVFKFAAEALSTAVTEALKRADITLEDVACIVPHQANERIIKYAAKKLNRPLDFFQLSIAHRGNSSAASVPMSLCDAYESGRIKPGNVVVLVAFGGGFTSGAVVFEA